MDRWVYTPADDHPIPDGAQVIFLGGPIRGTSNWHRRAIQELVPLISKPTIIASPRCMPFHGDFNLQVAWETSMLQAAAKTGVILFWLPAETPSVQPVDRTYAQSCRFQLGEWLAHSELEPIRLVVGLEPRFSGYHYIRQRLLQFRTAPICRTLKATCAVAVDLLGLALGAAMLAPGWMEEEDES